MGQALQQQNVELSDLSFDRSLIEAAKKRLNSFEEATAVSYEAAEIYKTLFLRSPSPIALVGGDGSILECNEAFSKLLKRPGYSIEGTHCESFTHTDDIEIDNILYDALKQEKIDYYQLYKRYIDAAGEVIPILLTVHMIKNLDGTGHYAISHVLDLRILEAEDFKPGKVVYPKGYASQ